MRSLGLGSFDSWTEVLCAVGLSFKCVNYLQQCKKCHKACISCPWEIGRNFNVSELHIEWDPCSPPESNSTKHKSCSDVLLSWKIPWPHTFLCKKVTKIVCCCHMCTFSIPWGRSCQFWNSWGWRAQLWKGVLQSQSQKMAVTLKIIWFQAPIICSAFFPSFSESQNERIWDVSDDWEPNSFKFLPNQHSLSGISYANEAGQLPAGSFR